MTRSEHLARSRAAACSARGRGVRRVCWARRVALWVRATVRAQVCGGTGASYSASGIEIERWYLRWTAPRRARLVHGVSR